MEPETTPGLDAELLTLRFDPTHGSFDDTRLRSRLAEVQLVSLREHFFDLDGVPHMACMLTYRAAHSKSRPPASTLAKSDQPLYDRLRQWRSERAREDGVPAYVLFSNRELQAIAGARPDSPSALRRIPGIGDKKVERYGAVLLAQLGQEHQAPDEGTE